MKRSADFSDEMAPVVAFEDRYDAGYADPRHAHGRAQLSFALSGVMAVNTDDASFVLPPHRAIWIPAHKTHQTICRSDVAFQVLYVDPGLVPQLTSCRVFEVSPLVRALVGEVTGFPRDYAMQGRAARIVQLLLEEIETVSHVPGRTEMPADRRLRRVCEAIIADPSDTRDINHWAREAGMARRTFTRTFREQTGMGLATWRRQVRLKEAASRIVAGETITSVAYEVGYDSPSAFTAMFHRAFGAAPREYLPR